MPEGRGKRNDDARERALGTLRQQLLQHPESTLAEQAEAAFVAAFRYMKNRISAFTSLPVASLDRASLRVRLTEIGQSEGASSSRNSAA